MAGVLFSSFFSLFAGGHMERRGRLLELQEKKNEARRAFRSSQWVWAPAWALPSSCRDLQRSPCRTSECFTTGLPPLASDVCSGRGVTSPPLAGLVLSLLDFLGTPRPCPDCHGNRAAAPRGG